MGRELHNQLNWHILRSTAARDVVNGLLDAEYRISDLILMHYVRLE